MAITHDQKSLSMVFPAYNEQDNIVEAVQSAQIFLRKRFKKYEIIIVDDGSKDLTASRVKQIAQKDKNIKILTHTINLGYGQAVYDGLSAAKSSLIFFSDSDLQFNLSEMDDFLGKIDACDAIVGYRRKRVEGLSRSLNMYGWKILLALMLKIKFKDIDCAFKLFKRKTLDGIKITCGGAMFSAELMYKISHNGSKILEMPVNHYPRTKGKPTGANFKVIIRAFKELITFARLTKNGKTDI